MEYLPKELADALRTAHTEASTRASRLSLRADGQVWPILRKWRGGLALNADHIDHLRGDVAIYEGSRHIATGLIVASEVEGGELICNLKRETPVSDHAALDFVREKAAPAGYLSKA
ncbi:hypothetical protein ERN12_13965 [Rhodobacteraceae bacterium]|nr:hypothetical protein ERN12_13965 [Paracoccaceae bacterium]